MKRDVPFMWIIFSLFPWQPFQSVHCENKFREVLNKDPVTKISSTEFAVFGPALREYLFRENFCPQNDRTLQLELTALQLYARLFISYQTQLTTIYMPMNIIIKLTNKVFLLKSLNFMSCVIEVKRRFLSWRKKKHSGCSKNNVRKFQLLENFMWRIVSHT